MPADFFIDPRCGMVFSKAHGVLSLIDVMDHMDRLHSHPDFRPAFNQLFDFREVTAFPMSFDDLRSLARRSIFSANSQRAYVVRTDWQFGLGRVFSTYRDLAGESGIQIFRSMEEALAWLGLAAEPDVDHFANFRPQIIAA
jgi:hypothetical protein